MTRTRTVQSEICARRRPESWNDCKTRERRTTRVPASRNLAFGELEPLAGAFLAVLLALVLARDRGSGSRASSACPQFRVELHQSPGDAQTGCARLAGDAAAIREDQDDRTCPWFRWPASGCRTMARAAFRREVILERAVVDLDLALAGPQEHASHRCLAAARSQILNYRRCH